MRPSCLIRGLENSLWQLLEHRLRGKKGGSKMDWGAATEVWERDGGGSDSGCSRRNGEKYTDGEELCVYVYIRYVYIWCIYMLSEYDNISCRQHCRMGRQERN